SKAPINRSIVIASMPSTITGVCEQILSELEANNFSDEDIFAVHLALQEAFLNALKHGNKMDAGKEIKVNYILDLDRIEISMTDEGSGFDPGSVPDPRLSENLYKVEGRGVLLMCSYMDVVKFNERGNCVHMVRYKEKPHLTETHKQAQV
ncbi:MAG: ATP-binding protein, partial [Planctomycetota bacterium]